MLLACAACAVLGVSAGGKSFTPYRLTESAIHVVLSDPDPVQRNTAALHLGWMDPEPPDEAVEALRKALADDGSDDVKKAACWGLMEFGPRAAPATDELADLLGTARPDMQMLALRVLLAIGPEAEGALGPIRKAFRSENANIRMHAAAAAIGISGSARPYISVFTEALAGDQPGTTPFHAALLLREVGPAAEPAIPALLEALRGTGPPSALAAEALGSIGRAPEKVVPALLRVVTERGPKEIGRREAILSLARFPTEKSRTVPVLLDVVQERDGNLDKALRALAELGYRSDSLVATLADLLDSPDWVHRRSAYHYLSHFPQPTGLFVERAVKAVGSDDDRLVRQEALSYLERLVDVPESRAAALRGIVKAVDDEHWRIRSPAVRALASAAGDDGRSVAAGLTVALSDRGYHVVRTAVRGFLKMESIPPEAAARLRELREEYPHSPYRRWDRRYGLRPLPELIDRALAGTARTP